MKLETFFEKFDQFADAPNAVAKMRELILDFAIGGRLLPSSKNGDQPVAADWPRQTLGSAVSLITKGSTPTSYGHQYEASGIPFVKVENIGDGVIKRSSIEQFISESTHEFLKRSQLESGDILFSIAGTIGKTCVVSAGDVPANTNQALAIIRGVGASFEISFLKMQLDSFVANKVKEKARGGAMPNVSLGDLRDLQVVVPPLAEQKRIVAKVDELMALCDRLEAQQQERETRHAGLARASLARFADAPTSANLHHLFHPSYTIPPADLRKTILTLAVQGKLVAQDSEDTPALWLLASAGAERARLVSERRIRPRLSAPVEAQERPFEIPAAWEWARLLDVGHELGQKVPDKPFTYIDVGSIDSDKGRISDRVETLGPNEAPSRARKLVVRGTVIYSTVRPYLLNIAIVDQDHEPEPIASTAFGILHPFSGIDNRYLFYWLRSAPFTAYVQEGMKGMAYPAINDEKFYSGFIAVPPPAEQKRIVMKLDQLMALVDELETRLATSRATAGELMEAIVAELTE